MDRAGKTQYVEQLNQDFQVAGCLVITHYKGLSVAEMNELRQEMRDAGAKFKVTKNTLTKIALGGTQFEGVKDMFTGPTAIAYSEDPVAAAKATMAFNKKNDKLEVLGGALGNEMLDQNGVKALASMPSLDELRGKIVGMLNTPATRLATVLQAPAGQLARVVDAYAHKG